MLTLKRATLNRVRQLTRIDQLSTNLSILAKSKESAPIKLECIDLIKHPSAGPDPHFFLFFSIRRLCEISQV